MPILNWIGKDKVINHHNEVPFHALKKKFSYNSTESKNMIIHGDNLVALKSLLPKYVGQIDCVYIDPPYNTGNEGWIYNDNVNDPTIKKWLGKAVGDEETDLSRHDKWLCMMYPRLKIIHELMSKNACIFVSIDDNELYNLKLLMNDIFGPSNFIGNIIRETVRGGSKNKLIKNANDYILVYAKDKTNIAFKGVSTGEVNDLCLEDEHGFFSKGRELNKWGAGSRREDSPSMWFPIPGPEGDVYPIRNDGSEGRWRWGKSKLLNAVKNGDVLFEKRSDGSYIAYEKVRVVKEKEKRFSTLFTEKYYNANGSQSLKNIFGTMMSIFDYAKPVELIKDIFTMVGLNKDSIVLDAFAGSGTLGQAVLEMNHDDGGNRNFIEIEMGDYAENITAERAKRVIDGYSDVEGTGGDFSFYEIGESLFDETGNLNKNISVDDIRKYIFYTETRMEPEKSNSDFLGCSNGIGYFLYYNILESTCLNLDYLKGIKNDFSYYVIYADSCVLSKEQLEKYHIIFKKIPRDIMKY